MDVPPFIISVAYRSVHLSPRNILIALDYNILASVHARVRIALTILVGEWPDFSSLFPFRFFFSPALFLPIR